MHVQGVDRLDVDTCTYTMVDNLCLPSYSLIFGEFISLVEYGW